jgi:magnesium-transporting ATPase (P-type)
MDHREAKIQKAVNLLEQDLDFLGVSGVEDKLQLNV